MSEGQHTVPAGMPPLWAVRAGHVLAVLLVLAGVAHLLLVAWPLGRGLGAFVQMLVAFATVGLGYALTEGLRVVGQLLGAVVGGMHAMCVFLGPLRAYRRRSGWRIERTPTGAPWENSLTAFPSTRNPLRRQHWLLHLGGPLANLSAAACIWTASTLAEGAAAAALVGLAILALCRGLAPLIPAYGAEPSDGLCLLLLARGDGGDDGSPEYALARVNALSVEGTHAEDLPPELLERMAIDEPLMALMHLWFCLKAHQNRGEWAKAAALAAPLSELAQALADFPGQRMRSFISLVQLETRFSAAMAGQAVALDDAMVCPSWNGTLPWIAPRCAALGAAMAGDASAAAAHLAAAEAAAEQAYDSPTRRSETLLRAAVAARL